MPPIPVSIRLNPFKGCDGPEGSPVPWSPYGRILPERPNFTLDPLFHAGCYYVQDSSAMYVGHIFRKLLSGPGLLSGRSATILLQPLRVLDLCAAPGGKTTDLAASLREMCGDAFELVSNEVMAKRVRILADNVAAWGDENVKIVSADPSVIGRELPDYFDVIVADVPCSGEGMFRKDPRAEKEWSPELVQLCAARQKRILADVWPALKPGGLLVYSTCTYEDAENDANLEWAASELGGEIISPENEFESYGVQLTRHGNLLRAGESLGEGQWVGAMRKTETPEAPAPAEEGLDIVSGEVGQGNAGSADSAKMAVSGRGQDAVLLRKAVRGGSGCHGPSRLRPAASGLAALHPLTIDFASFDTSTPRVELDLQQALRYLQRDSFPLPQAPLGPILVCSRGHPRGYMKNIGSRCNNLFPKNRRILMDV